MKRFLLIFFLAIVGLTAYAKPPKLNVECLFDGRYNNNKSVTISIYKNNGNYYRGITVKNNQKIIKDIAEEMEKDKHRAKEYSDYQAEDGRYTSIQIVNNGETIYIGLQRDSSGGAFFFIQGKEKAFE